MKCEELLAALNDYVDGDIDPAICESLQAHLDGCNPCQIVVDNIRQTITLYKSGEPVALPPEVHQRLCNALRQCWAARFGHPPR
jgi:anti-sigma factor RsiW